VVLRRGPLRRRLVDAPGPAEALDRVGAFTLLAVVGIVALGLTAVAAGGTSTRAQAFLAFAVLYGGFHLRAAGGLLVTAAAVVCGGVLLFDGGSGQAALTDLLFFGSMLTVIGVLLVRSMERQERMMTALQRQADVDPLTGLVTRRVLDAALTAALADPRTRDRVALAVMDVDDFKSINDRYGHPVGDDALAHLARVIGAQTRAGDAVVSRLGGDEVAVLLTGCTGDVAARRAEQMLEAVRSTPLVLPDGTLLALSISIGLASAPRHGRDLRSLYAAADEALYAAKRAGRDRVAVAG
jgi:diguanylate cyclase (GGDEF)-like protein